MHDFNPYAPPKAPLEDQISSVDLTGKEYARALSKGVVLGVGMLYVAPTTIFYLRSSFREKYTAAPINSIANKIARLTLHSSFFALAGTLALTDHFSGLRALAFMNVVSLLYETPRFIRALREKSSASTTPLENRV